MKTAVVMVGRGLWPSRVRIASRVCGSAGGLAPPRRRDSRRQVVLLIALIAALAGCSPREAAGGRAGNGPETQDAVAAAYKAGHGVRLGKAAAAFVGLRVSEVETRDLPGAAGVAAIPRAALLRTIRGDFVFVQNGDWLLRSPVKAGAEAGGWIEIREGLYEGDRVAVAAVEALWLAEIAAVNGGVGCADGH